ncbi:cobalt-precorrin-5B (C1)-methyltransferase [Desulfosarcina sp. BuS5]|uniref:cobalt-precorrin-5B (C(1))-methyltransferase CbiD n=1 Tax=Desulfosarcina sp. BuS5 TaxID=933262 RepID=UPI0004851245|nr:cobalt-precorrin-5B (C(1))-methyltransferase CbiD [Desulfosarcina sp. BuS5]WDN87300.1 cobalt-precorrin-5B (C1)-methyltransferase [Desulfosarcina sp. BuS5]
MKTEQRKSKKKRLKSGFTTGTAAAAAAKGALALILEKKIPASVRIRLLTGDYINIKIERCVLKKSNTAECIVIKDAGDDPDITHRAEIGAIVSIDKEKAGRIHIAGGRGVGKVTKPGLEIPPGEHAINPGPLKMIIEASKDMLIRHKIRNNLKVSIFVPQGEELAKKTLNARLGILGGISILGTTGIARPLSHDAYIATIKSSISVANAVGLDTVILTTGRRSEKLAQAFMPDLAEEAFIQIGDFFEMAIKAASEKKLKTAILAVFFAKAIKQAQGIPHTHASKAELTLEKLAEWCLEIIPKQEQGQVLAKKVRSANTARHSFDFIYPQYPEIVAYVGKKMIQSAKKFSTSDIRIESIIFDYSGNVIFDSM